MKQLLIVLFILPLLTYSQQTVIGKWKTVDDESGKERSIIELFEKNSLVHGKIIKTMPGEGEDADPICNKCDPEDSRYNKKIIGMEILQNMKKVGNEYSDGFILDPENGKIYKCKIWLEGAQLMVRGYWGPFYRTQIWKKVH